MLPLIIWWTFKIPHNKLFFFRPISWADSLAFSHDFANSFYHHTYSAYSWSCFYCNFTKWILENYLKKFVKSKSFSRSQAPVLCPWCHFLIEMGVSKTWVLPFNLLNIPTSFSLMISRPIFCFLLSFCTRSSGQLRVSVFFFAFKDLSHSKLWLGKKNENEPVRMPLE